MEPQAPRPFRLSVRSLMILIALFALFFMPFVYMARRVEQERIRAEHALREALAAREVAEAARDAEVRARRALEAARKGTPPAKSAPGGDIAQPPQ
jgi:hypothetical protein